MRGLTFAFLLLSLAACGGSSTEPTATSIAGNWNSALLRLNLSQTGSDLSGSGSFTDLTNGGCKFLVSGSYNAGTVTITLGSDITCTGSFTGTASGLDMSGFLSFSYSADASYLRHSTLAYLTLIKQ